jgi:hypothetical protein
LEALRVIVANEKGMFSINDRKIADGLLQAIPTIQKLDETNGPLAFRIHPKGTGVICTNEGGI